MKITNKKFIEVRDWDNLVKETYGKRYSFQQQDGCKSRGIFQFTLPFQEWELEEAEEEMNDSIPEVINGEEMGVKFEVWLSRDSKEWNGEEDERFLDLFWDRNFYPSFHTVANDLYLKGLIEAGDYVINIDW